MQGLVDLGGQRLIDAVLDLGGPQQQQQGGAAGGAGIGQAVLHERAAQAAGMLLDRLGHRAGRAVGDGLGQDLPQGGDDVIEAFGTGCRWWG